MQHPDLSRALERWSAQPVSWLERHEQDCCRTAEEWCFAVDRSLAVDGRRSSGPSWINQRYEWGPSDWPLSLCQAVRLKVLDCGALAALARAVLTQRGLDVLSVQFVQQYSQQDTEHWRRKWGSSRSVEWIQGHLAYHEACAVRQGGTIRIWDPSVGEWVTPEHVHGYGAVRAIRVWDSEAEYPSDLRWGPHIITANRWQILGLDEGVGRPPGG